MVAEVSVYASATPGIVREFLRGSSVACDPTEARQALAWARSPPLGWTMIVWSTGAADRPLSEIGLNRYPCIVNGFGAKFCGQDAKDYCHRIERVVGVERAGDCGDITDS